MSQHINSHRSEWLLTATAATSFHRLTEKTDHRADRTCTAAGQRRLTHLTVLVELAAEGDGEVGRRARGVVAAEQIFAVVEGAASTLAYVHVLEARLHTATQFCKRVAEGTGEG